MLHSLPDGPCALCACSPAAIPSTNNQPSTPPNHPLASCLLLTRGPVCAVCVLPSSHLLRRLPVLGARGGTVAGGVAAPLGTPKVNHLDLGALLAAKYLEHDKEGMKGLGEKRGRKAGRHRGREGSKASESAQKTEGARPASKTAAQTSPAQPHDDTQPASQPNTPRTRVLLSGPPTALSTPPCACPLPPFQHQQKQQRNTSNTKSQHKQHNTPTSRLLTFTSRCMLPAMLCRSLRASAA